MNLVNLNATTRDLMLREIEDDIAKNQLYTGKRLSATGRKDYPDLIKAAAEKGSDATLAAELLRNGRLNETEERSKPNGGTTVVKVPSNAAEMLAEGEFNRFYIRAVCLQAIEKETQVEVYRAKAVASPRSESERKIGSKVDPKTLLADLRRNIGVDTALGLPAGPNSGLSVKLG